MPPKKKRNWPRLCNRGKLQSPINLNSRFAYPITLPSMKLENFKKIRNLRIRNCEGLVTVELGNICPCLRPKFSGGGLDGTFFLDKLQFHWPSEHFIDGIQYDLEAQFVFVNEKYVDARHPFDIPFATTVMSVLFFVTTSTRSKNFSVIAEALKEVRDKPNKSVILKKELDFFQFLPYDQDNFYKYTGSLTAKLTGCKEHVNWIVLKNTANIGVLDLKNISNITGPHGELITENNRELQDLNDRIVYTRLIL